jgi:transcriptional regulator with XRE-family HTH domain
MAAKAGVSPSYLSRLESGDETHPPSEDALRRFADVLGEPPDMFMRLAGRLPKDVKQYAASTANVADFLRKARDEGYGPADFARLSKEVFKKKGDGENE